LNLRIRKNVLLYRDALLAKISESILGDKLIEITPGIEKDYPLGDGDEIKDTYVEKGFNEMLRDLPDITRDIRKLTSELTKTVEQINKDDSVGHVMRRLTEIADTVAQLSARANDVFGRNEARIEQIIGDVSSITGDTRLQYKDILQNINDASAEIKKLFADLNGIVSGDETDMNKNAGEIKGILAKANRSMEQLESITRKIDQGQGTLGRLINDDRIATKTEGILDDAASITSRLARLQLHLDLRSEFLVRQNSAKSYFGIRLLPSSDMYYMVELIDDPRGSAEVTQVCSTDMSLPEETRCDANHKIDKIKIKNKFKYSVELAKRFYFITLRLGIIQNSGGVGMDWHFFNDDLEFRFDIFQFGTNEYNVSSKPRLKAWVVYRPSWLANHIYLTAGVDDPFNGLAMFDYFFGAGFSFNDQDLKALFTITGMPK
jgi:hypothetical protein